MFRWIAIIAAVALAVGAAYAQSSSQTQPTLPLGQNQMMHHMNPPMMSGNDGMEPGVMWMMQMMRMMESGMMGPGMQNAGMMNDDMTGPMCGRQIGMMGMTGSPASHLEARLAFARAELAITGEQDAAWQAYAAALRGQLKSMSTHMTDMQRANMRDAALPAKIDARIAMLEGQLARLKAVREPAVALYGELDHGQKRKADMLLLASRCM